MHDAKIDFHFPAQTDTRAKAKFQNIQGEGKGIYAFRDTLSDEAILEVKVGNFDLQCEVQGCPMA